MKLGPNELGDLIGEGGMGRVYRARVFATNIVTIFGVNGLQYCVSADGQRILISNAAGDVSNNTSPIAVILNWRAKH
jgi:hypothetical protein